MSFFSVMAAAVKAEASKLVSELAPLWAQLKPAIQATEQELATAAVAAVVAQIPGVSSGTVKFDAAASNVVTSLGSVGKTAAANLIGAAVQLAFNEIQTLRPAP